MKHTHEKHSQERWLRYGIYFGLPIIVMVVVFALQQMFPLGKNTLLTYDLNEQYIDFFAFYRDTILHHPSQFFYSFNNGLGGETIGLWAYYLLSPFNLILLITPEKWMPLGVLIMTLLKYGFAGFAIGYYFEHVYQEKTIRKWLPTIAVSYALMGWAIANQFNIMWLDVLIILPFILHGIDKLVNEEKSLYFILFLALLLFVNFYMGYMVCIFACLYFIWTAICNWNGWKNFGKRFVRFAISGILSATTVAFLLCPTYYDIKQSKGQFMMESLPLKMEYTPWHFLSKFIVGALNDNQIQNGLPNLFIGSLVIIGFVLYFTAKKISLREKITSAIITFFLVLSICWAPLNLFWHIFQYPVFYPYRFSFVVGIWMTILGVRGLVKIQVPKWWQLAIALVIPVSCWSLVALNLNKFKFLSANKLLWSAVFFGVIYLLTAIILLQGSIRVKNLSIGLIATLGLIGMAVVEMGTNAQLTLKAFQWTTQKDYAKFVTDLDKNVKWIQKNTDKNQFYRIGKTYQRSENDSLQAGFNGVSNFSSTQRASVTHFMSMMGQPTFTGKENYTKGTPLTDALLDVRYYLSPTDQFNNLLGSNVTPASSYRPDISYYSKINVGKTTVYDNPLAMGLGFAASSHVLSMPQMSPTQTVANQEAVMNAITNDLQQYFNEVGYSIEAVNCKLEGGANGNLVTIDENQPASYSIILRNISVNPYYVQMDSNIFWNASITVNDHPLPAVGNISQPALVNVAANVPGTTVTIKIVPNNGQTISLNSIKVYELDLNKLQKAVYKVKENEFKISHLGKLKVSGTINISKDNEVLMTTIPYNKGWHIKVDGQSVEPKEAFDTFIAVPLSEGQHKVTFSFWPPLLNLGIIISLISIGILILVYKKEKI